MNKINKISIFENIRSDFLLKKIFNNLKENKLLNIIKYNKHLIHLYSIAINKEKYKKN